MRLKKLVLQGYKTFASRTEFVFDQGITAIVGPNGSGKSNIADALRWVLGEQSYSTLRGKRTTDMIFTGSQKRPRAGMAQSILTLDNSDGWLPIDFSEVEIGRRAFRSGENEYILNGQKVRLKDITDLLATSGLAERTYTIIGQGLIDQALSLRADERRALFEEAAGISHYKSRRAETMRRLQETQRNLERIHDILSEIRPRLNSLRRQATRAQNYEQLTADLNHALSIWYGYRWEQAKHDLRDAREEAAAAESKWQESRQTLAVHQANLDDIRRQINRLQNQISETEETHEDTRQLLEKTRRETAILRERKGAFERRLAEIKQEIPPLQTQQAQATAELNAALADFAIAQAELQSAQAELRQFNAGFEAKQAEINRWQQTLQQRQSARQQAQTKLAQAEGQLSQLQARQAETDESGDEATTAEITALVQQIDEAATAVAAAQTILTTLENERRDLQKQRQALIAELKTMRRDLSEREKKLGRQRRDVARLEARVDLLDQLRQKDVVVPDGADIVGALTNFLTIPGEWETAVSAALAARLRTIVVPDSRSLWALVDGAGQPVTLAALADLTPPPSPPPPDDTAVVGWANTVIQTNKAEVQPLVNLLLGQVLLVSDARAAYRLASSLPAGAMAVTAAGFVAAAGGLVTAGQGQAPDDSLAREKEWRAAQEQLAGDKDTLEQAETAVTTYQADIQAKQQTVDDLQEQERVLSQSQQVARDSLNQAERQVDRWQQQQRYLEQQQAAQARERQRLHEQITGFTTQIQQQRETLVTVAAEVETAQVRLEALPIAEAAQERQTLRQQIQSAQTIVAGRQAVVDSRRATLNQLDGQIRRLQEHQASFQDQLSTLSITEKEADLQQLQTQIEKIETALRPLRQRLKERRQELTAHEDKIAHLQKSNHDLETIYTQVRIALTQRENTIEGLQERIKADIGIVALHYDDDQTGPTPLPIREVVEQLPVVDELPDDLEETIQSLRGQMQRMGAINPDAPAEYEETQERFEFLTQQIEDLNNTEAQLREVIAELDDLTSRAFARTVQDVDKVFGSTFTQLFGGGSGRLVLTDPDDLTISGVDIIARLPNRREQGLSVLSGGERSLTAAALIFSLLKVSPTPFCVMDEVDAALDEANINRFRELLVELSENTQFIVITHNRGTVQAAQTIYGISMGIDSASQGISIKPEDYLKQKELHLE